MIVNLYRLLGNLLVYLEWVEQLKGNISSKGICDRIQREN